MAEPILHALADSREAAHRSALLSTYTATLDLPRHGYATAYADALYTGHAVPAPAQHGLTYRTANPVAVKVANIILATVPR